MGGAGGKVGARVANGRPDAIAQSVCPYAMLLYACQGVDDSGKVRVLGFCFRVKAKD